MYYLRVPLSISTYLHSHWNANEKVHTHSSAAWAVNQPTVIFVAWENTQAARADAYYIHRAECGPRQLIALECVSVQEGHSCGACSRALLCGPRVQILPRRSLWYILHVLKKREGGSGHSITHNVPLIKRCGNEICLLEQTHSSPDEFLPQGGNSCAICISNLRKKPKRKKLLGFSWIYILAYM